MLLICFLRSFANEKWIRFHQVKNLEREITARKIYILSDYLDSMLQKNQDFIIRQKISNLDFCQTLKTIENQLQILHSVLDKKYDIWVVCILPLSCWLATDSSNVADWEAVMLPPRSFQMRSFRSPAFGPVFINTANPSTVFKPNHIPILLLLFWD